MTDSPSARAASLLICAGSKLDKGDPVPLPLTMAAMFNLPGDPAGSPVWPLRQSDLGCRRGDAGASRGRAGRRLPVRHGGDLGGLLRLLKSGDRILLPSDGYYTTRVLAERFLKPLGVSFDLRPTGAYLDGGFDGYRLVFVETPGQSRPRHLRHRGGRRRPPMPPARSSSPTTPP